jgi:ubiquinol oxidase
MATRRSTAKSAKANAANAANAADTAHANANLATSPTRRRPDRPLRARPARTHGGAMADLTTEQRRKEQQVTLETPRRRYGLDARFMFWLEDRCFGSARTLPKFKARELVARTAYQGWEQGAYFLVTVSHDRMTRARRIYEQLTEFRAEQDNEQWHLLLLEEMIEEDGVSENRFRYRLLAQAMAFGFYQVNFLLYSWRRPWTHRLNADIEDHAEHEYADLVDEHPEWDTRPFRSSFASGYGTFESRADVLRQIGYDERVHKDKSLARLETEAP